MGEGMTECKHEWGFSERAPIECIRCTEPFDLPLPIIGESRIREIVREEIARAAQPCRHEKWIEMGNDGDVCRSCGTKR